MHAQWNGKAHNYNDFIKPQEKLSAQTGPVQRLLEFHATTTQLYYNAPPDTDTFLNCCYGNE